MLVAYGFSWLFWIPDALIAQGDWNAPDNLSWQRRGVGKSHAFTRT